MGTWQSAQWRRPSIQTWPIVSTDRFPPSQTRLAVGCEHLGRERQARALEGGSVWRNGLGAEDLLINIQVATVETVDCGGLLASVWFGCLGHFMTWITRNMFKLNHQPPLLECGHSSSAYNRVARRLRSRERGKSDRVPLAFMAPIWCACQSPFGMMGKIYTRNTGGGAARIQCQHPAPPFGPC
ncbi:hypothetical protein FOIG_16775 [Fusarium odoratissimum NRRL 54006]|uniref:Uncharacterized protein n=1 Tax=Fusarium odoratissimum (strain NRRL 54006) TaxID=1089451 RepID=X0JYK7_FUSO5|nr:uncharacterized protein FOIG_16775 [Fusarium odoratissimum NRRL 54006]EXL89944.1 hypothetical protein FOIG_16775 [Fusarium odoratissimum NRRL 54006]